MAFYVERIDPEPPPITSPAPSLEHPIDRTQSLSPWHHRRRKNESKRTNKTIAQVTEKERQRTEMKMKIESLKSDVQRLMTKIADTEKEMENERKEMANKEKQWTATIDAMKKERESETEKIMTLLEEQNRWQKEQNRRREQQFEQLLVAIAQSQNVSTTQPNRNPMTDVNQTTAADTVLITLLHRHSELSPWPKLNQKQKKKRKKRTTNSTAFVPRLPTIPECDSENVYDDGMKTNESAAVTEFEYSSAIPPNGTPTKTADIPTVSPMNAVPTRKTKKNSKQSPASIALQSYAEYSKSATRKESPRPLVPCNAHNTKSRRTPGSKIAFFDMTRIDDRYPDEWNGSFLLAFDGQCAPEPMT